MADFFKKLTGKKEPEKTKPVQLKRDTGTPDFVEIGGSPVPGLTLRHVLRGHTGGINRIAWSPDGKYLASPSDDKTIRIWDVSTGECVRVLEENTDGINSVAWSPDGKMIASSAAPFLETLGGNESANPINIWASINTDWTHVKSLRGHHGNVQSLAWSIDGRLLASGGRDGQVLFWDTGTWKTIFKEKFDDWVFCLSWSPDGNFLAAGTRWESPALYLWNMQNLKKPPVPRKHKSGVASISWSFSGKVLATGIQNNTICIWDTTNEQALNVLESHVDTVSTVSFSRDERLLASKSTDDTVKIWRTDIWQNIVSISESSGIRYEDSKQWGSLSFHPQKPNILATLGEDSTVIRIWDLEYDTLISNSTIKDSLHYTTAKLVLVGDSGVGKTGLGWRLAHGEFKEHASTHGQQFWSIPQLNLKREDGTDCEAVLWDLAGQHVYRQVHSIFLDNISAALVLFDPTNRQDPLKGAQFWLEQLKGKGKLPPTVLVGARVDRGAPALSQAELDQFCQRYGIAGGYISTSAMKGDGLDELMELLKKQIPWDEMTATVTTVTFKKIKDYVLSLKEKTDRKGVLVNPQELRTQLQATDKDWEFTDAEMMTAVGHLETHGYVSVLHNSAGEQFVLLAPDVLVNLAASIMLLADKNARELGAVSETELLTGNIPFDELKGLEKAEQQILIDAAVLRFLEHSICFRETLNDDTLLIFPSLIKQKRPLQDDIPSTDDISYVVRGRVENIYASLVVLLGYTPSFNRINQWQNQAQYEMKEGEFCGFRSIEEREGEIELVLYYGDKMRQDGRDKFQELFEQFLYQREVEITRFPPVVCKNNHQQKRTTVVERAKEGKTFVYCDECGDKVMLPDFEKPQTIGIGASPWLQREEAMARLRSSYEKHLTNIKSYRRGWASPRVYISRLSEQNTWAEKLIHDLRDAGVYIVEKPEDLKTEDFAIILDTSAYRKAFQASSSALANDTKVIRSKLSGDKKKLLSLACEGLMSEHSLKQCTPGDFCDETHYSVSLFNLLLELYAIPLNHKGFEPLRKSLHEQWEQSLSRLPVVAEPIPAKKRFDVALSFPGEYRKQVEAIANSLAKALGQERVLYDKYYEAEFARPDLDIYLQNLYHNESDLIVTFLCADYERKEWCGIEWRAIKDLINRKEKSAIMFMRFDKAEISGVFLGDGYIDIAKRDTNEVAKLILDRLQSNRNA